MDWLSRIVAWLSDHEAAISAVAAIIVIAGVAFAGIRWLLLRGTGGTPEKLLVRPGRRTVLTAASAAVLVVLAGVATWLMLPDEPATEIASEEDPLLALPTGPVVAVLPFENLSPDPDQEFFSDGLTDEIITELSRFRDLFVIARNSTFRYKGQAVDVRQLKRELGARYVLEGSVQKAGTTLRVTAQLLDARDATHVWADSYDRDLSTSNIFAVQDEIAQRVVATIAGLHGFISQARTATIKQKPTANLDAYECVARVSWYYRDNYVAPEHLTLRTCLERAVESDPGYATAWAWLGSIYLDEYRFNYNPRPKPLARALEAARRAVELDPNSQAAHWMLADIHFFRGELDPFFAEAERAIALNPNHATVLAELGEKLNFVGDPRGIALVRKAALLDPFHPTWLNFPIAYYHYERHEYEEALAAARKITIPGYYWPQIYLAAIYGQLGRQDEAHAAAQELLRVYPNFTIETMMEQCRRNNYTDESTDHWIEGLQKAGLPE